MRFGRDDRGVSRLLSYMLTVAVAMLLITGLLIAGSELVEDQRERTMRSQMTVVGQQVAGSLEATDRLVSTTGDAPHDIEEVRIRRLNVSRSITDRIVGSSYTVHVYPPENKVFVNVTGEPLSVVVPYRTATPVRETTVHGGEILINYTRAPDPNELVVLEE